MGPSLLLIRNLCACIQSRAGEPPAHPNKEGLTHGQAQNGHSSRLALKGAWIHQASLLHTRASLLHLPKMGRGMNAAPEALGVLGMDWVQCSLFEGLMGEGSLF